MTRDPHYYRAQRRENTWERIDRRKLYGVVGRFMEIDRRGSTAHMGVHAHDRYANPRMYGPIKRFY